MIIFALVPCDMATVSWMSVTGRVVMTCVNSVCAQTLDWSRTRLHPDMCCVRVCVYGLCACVCVYVCVCAFSTGSSLELGAGHHDHSL